VIVIDASVITSAVLATEARGDRIRDKLISDDEWVAPQHWPAEVFSAIRGLVIGGKVGDSEGWSAVGRLSQLAIESVPLTGLLAPMWTLRHEISGYDAAYVALAATRGLTLVTADAPLARAAVRHCRVELVS
jgi:predicted nucleic acid-binding protein